MSEDYVKAWPQLDPHCPCRCLPVQCENYCTTECHEARVGIATDQELRETMTARFEPVTTKPPIRADILDEAKQAVCSDRNADYGEPIDNFTRWAGVCNSLGYRGPGGRDLKPHDLAIMSTAGKLSRAMQTPGKRDHSVDISGYGSLIYELVTLEDQ